VITLSRYHSTMGVRLRAKAVRGIAECGAGFGVAAGLKTLPRFGRLQAGYRWGKRLRRIAGAAHA